MEKIVVFISFFLLWAALVLIVSNFNKIKNYYKHNTLKSISGNFIFIITICLLLEAIFSEYYLISKSPSYMNSKSFIISLSAAGWVTGFIILYKFSNKKSLQYLGISFILFAIAHTLILVSGKIFLFKFRIIPIIIVFIAFLTLLMSLKEQFSNKIRL